MLLSPGKNLASLCQNDKVRKRKEKKKNCIINSMLIVFVVLDTVVRGTWSCLKVEAEKFTRADGELMSHDQGKSGHWSGLDSAFGRFSFTLSTLKSLAIAICTSGLYFLFYFATKLTIPFKSLKRSSW